MIRQPSHTAAEDEGEPLRRRNTINSRFPSDGGDSVLTETRANIARFVRLISSEGITDSNRYTLESAENGTTEVTTAVTMETPREGEAVVEGVRAEEEVESRENGVKVETGSGGEGVKPEGDGTSEVSQVNEAEKESKEQEQEEEVEEEEVEVVKEEEEEEEKEEENNSLTALGRVPSIDVELGQSPAFKFITRPDLYKFAKVSNSQSIPTPLQVFLPPPLPPLPQIIRDSPNIAPHLLAQIEAYSENRFDVAALIEDSRTKSTALSTVEAMESHMEEVGAVKSQVGFPQSSENRAE